MQAVDEVADDVRFVSRGISTAYRLFIGASGNLIGLANSEMTMQTAW